MDIKCSKCGVWDESHQRRAALAERILMLEALLAESLEEHRSLVRECEVRAGRDDSEWMSHVREH